MNQFRNKKKTLEKLNEETERNKKIQKQYTSGNTQRNFIDSSAIKKSKQLQKNM